ncbi:MAG: hypothetical protein MUF07_00800 [Steroidobacteraceae bacterium]|jgi:uncharacterized protein (AIM24 family)|nr:hypothetical protein [Steroidobacteraceae bacterium]
MLRLLALALRWLASQAGLLLLIVAVLLVAGWLRSEWAELRTLRAEVATQERLAANLRTELAAIDAALRREQAAWSQQVSAVTWPLRTELEGLEARIARAQPQWQAALRQFADLERQATRAREAARRADAELAALERAAWWWDRFVDPAKALALERARARARLLRGNAAAWGAARDRVAPAIEGAPMQALLAREAALRARIDALATAVSPRQRTLLEARERKAFEVTQVEALLGAQRGRAARDPRERLLAAVGRQLPLALGILALALLVPLAIKALFFFVLAPLASRQPPVRVRPDPAAPGLPPPSRSAVSQAIELAPHEELLVQPDHLQSTSQPASKRTQWLLNPALPFASLASGLYALTRIAPPPGGGGTRVVVAARADPLGELAVLELPAGAALVLQPRALAGVAKPAAEPLRITRHWRLASLHAWLTLQLRYLVFHGPCRLVLKGCRGVRAETPRAGEPRLVSQAATLGFSANLDYRTTRSETFVAYLLGRESLLNDLFSGGPGCFLYEEMPGRRRRAGVTGRGLEGVADAVLKAFGI